jgi:phosphate starvation-inducible membrane PsiE
VIGLVVDPISAIAVLPDAYLSLTVTVRLSSIKHRQIVSTLLPSLQVLKLVLLALSVWCSFGSTDSDHYY